MIFAGLLLAAATPCADPLPYTFTDGELGVARRACHRTEVSLRAGGVLVAEPEEFYGDLLAAGVLSASWAVDGETEIFASLELVRFETVLSSLTASAIGLGHTSLGASRTIAGGPGWTMSLAARAVLPTATGLYENARPLAGDLGLDASWALGERVAAYGRLGVLGSFALTSGAPDPRAGLGFTAGLAFAPWDVASLLFESSLQVLHDAPIDHHALGAGVRFHLGDTLGLELGARFPTAGHERATTSAGLRLVWTPSG